MTMPNAAPIPHGDASDEASQIDALMQDRSAVERLFQEHRLLREAVEHSPAAYCVYDAEDRLIAHNAAYVDIHADNREAAALFKTGETIAYGDLIRATLRGTVPADQLEKAVRDRVYAQRCAVGRAVERKYGDRGLFSVLKYKLPSGAVAGMAFDISALAARESAASRAHFATQAAAQTRAEILFAVGQRLRESLKSIVGSCQSALTAPDDQRDAQLRTAMVEGTDGLSLLDDLIDVSSLARDMQSSEDAPIRVGALMGGMHRLLDPLARSLNIALDLRPPAADLGLQADERAMKQIILNLVLLALRAAPAGGHVTMASMRSVEGEVIFSVDNSGEAACGQQVDSLRRYLSGQPPSEAEADLAWTTLSVVQSLADQHYANVDVSRSTAHGMRTTVIFPASRALSL